MQAPSLEALATCIGVDPPGLVAIGAEMNSYAATGRELAYYQGAATLDRNMGDPRHGAKLCLGPVRPPFRALKILPADGSTTVGLRIDGQSRVLDDPDLPIFGLYAAGLDTNSIWRGITPTHGCGVGPAMTLGYIAGRSLTHDENSFCGLSA